MEALVKARRGWKTLPAVAICLLSASWSCSTIKHTKKCLDELMVKQVFGKHRNLNAAELGVQSPCLLRGSQELKRCMNHKLQVQS